MKRFIQFCLLLLLINSPCASQAKNEVNTRQQLETIREKLRKDNLEAKSGSAMVYEFTRSKDNAKFMAEIFKNKKGDRALMILWIKGVDKKTFIYLDLLQSKMMMLSEDGMEGFEMTELTNIIEVLRPLRTLVKALNKEKADKEEVLFYPQVNLYLKGTGISSSLGLVSSRSLAWEALASDVSGIEIKENYYKFHRKKQGGYFMIDKQTGVLLEQKETIDGQTRQMKLISNKAWNGKVNALLPDVSKFKLDRKELNEEMIDKMTGGMLTDMLEKMIKDEAFAAEIKKNPKKVNQTLKEVYTAMWRNNNKLIPLPLGWSMKEKKFLAATKEWTAEEKQAWKKKAKDAAINELREKFFPKQNELSMELMFEDAAGELELDEAGEKRKKLVLETITRALYQAWAEVQIETLLQAP